MAKKALILDALLNIEIRTLSSIISLKCADFLVLTGIVIWGIVDIRQSGKCVREWIVV